MSDLGLRVYSDLGPFRLYVSVEPFEFSPYQGEGLLYADVDQAVRAGRALEAATGVAWYVEDTRTEGIDRAGRGVLRRQGGGGA